MLRLSTSIAALAAAGGAFAQAPAPRADASFDMAQISPPLSGSETVADVVVTARRREERAQTVPVAVSVATSEALERQGINNVSQLTQLVPSAQVFSTNPRNTTITIRGLGASYGLANDGLEQGVGVYIDQVYNARPATTSFDFVDIDRIEVLRGPQGTLFGKNTTAGALNMTTRAPSFAPEGAGEISYGSLNFFQAKATLSGPIVGDKLAARVSFVRTRRDGVLNNPVVDHRQNDVNGYSLRGQALYKASEDLTLRFYGDVSRQKTECCTQVYVAYGPTLKPASQQYPALAAGLGYAPPSTNPYDRLADINGAQRSGQTLGGVAAIVDYDFGPATLTSVSAYRKWVWRPASDRDLTRLDIVRQSANPSDQHQLSEELRLASNGAKTVDWLGGVYLFRESIVTTGVAEWGRDASYWLLPGSPAALLDGYKLFTNSRIDTGSAAAFGQATWNVSPKFRVTPGLRYTQEWKDGVVDQTVGGGLATTDPTLISRRLGVARPQAYTAAIRQGSLGGQLALAYDVNDDVHAYATYARGQKSGGINATGLPTTPAGLPAIGSAVIRPEKATTYELGLKTQWFHRLLTANLAAYYTVVNDYQANVVDAGPGAVRSYLANVEKVKVQGVELDASTRSFHGFSAYANLTWTDGEYASFKNGPCPLERISASTVACDLSGRELPGVSRWAGSGGVEYRTDVTLRKLEGQAYASLDGAYRSPYYADPATSIYTRLPASLVFNLRTGFRTASGVDLSVWVKNLLDEKYLQYVTVQTGNSGLIVGAPGDQRTFGVTLRARY